MRVPGPISRSSVMPVQKRSVTLAACSGNSDFTQLQTKITRFEGVVFFCKVSFIVTNTLKKVQLMRVPGPILRSSGLPVQGVVCEPGRMFRI